MSLVRSSLWLLVGPVALLVLAAVAVPAATPWWPSLERPRPTPDRTVLVGPDEGAPLARCDVFVARTGTGATVELLFLPAEPGQGDGWFEVAVAVLSSAAPAQPGYESTGLSVWPDGGARWEPVAPPANLRSLAERAGAAAGGLLPYVWSAQLLAELADALAGDPAAVAFQELDPATGPLLAAGYTSASRAPADLRRPHRARLAVVSGGGDLAGCKVRVYLRAVGGAGTEPATRQVTIDLAGPGGGDRGPDGAPMKLIPEGPFTMGSPPGLGVANQRPQRRIHLDAYRIHTHEVTNAQYAAFLNAAQPSEATLDKWVYLRSRECRIELVDGRYTVAPDDERHPVLRVSWGGAQAYAEHFGMQLPTEAQWEKAARGSADERRYPWGDEYDRDRLNAHGTQGADVWSGTAPVGSLPAGASPYGVLDLAGNAMEWCRDWFVPGNYAEMPERNPFSSVMVQGRRERSVRGGSYSGSYPPRFAVTYRGGHHPDVRLEHIGFRCVEEL